MAVADIYKAVEEYKVGDVARLVQEELDRGTPLREVLEDGLIAPLTEVGRKFSSGDLFVPEMLVAAKAVKKGLNVLQPIMTEAQTKPKGTVIMGTVKGDMHDIGKNLVSMMLEGAGFRVIDLGVDVPAENFVAAVNEHSAGIVGLSALLTTTIPAMRDTTQLLKNECPVAKVLVGGAPVSEKFAQEIGADGYAANAAKAAEIAVQLAG